jgi:hypothetical protein
MPDNYKFMPGRLYRMQTGYGYYFWEVESIRNSFDPTHRNEPVIVMYVRDPKPEDFKPELMFPNHGDIERLGVVFFEGKLWLAPKKLLCEYQV